MIFIVFPQRYYELDTAELSFSELEEPDIDKICSAINFNKQTTITTADNNFSTTLSEDELGLEFQRRERYHRRLYQRNQQSLSVTKCCSTLYKAYLANVTNTENKELGRIVLDVILGTVIFCV